MNAETVYQAYENIYGFSATDYGLLFLAGLFILFGFGFFIAGSAQFSDAILGIGVILIVIGCFIGIPKYLTGKEVAPEDYANWETNYAKPYLESLPEQKVESDKIVQISESSLTIIIDDSPITLSADKIKTVLKSGEKPYVTYQHLDKNLYRGYDEQYLSGFKNVILYVPTDYFLNRNTQNDSESKE